MGKRTDLNNALKIMSDRYEGAQADYRAAKKGRFNQRRKNVAPMGSSADYHIRSEPEYYGLIEDCYDLERNDSIVGQLLDRRTANVVQDGFRLRPDTTDTGVDTALKERWDDWANDPDQCDVSGEATFHDFEIASDWTYTLAGDCGASLTEDGSLQFFEPYLIRSEPGTHADTFLGVEMDDNRRRTKYYIAEDSADPYKNTFAEFTPIDTRDAYGRRQFFHVFNQKRMTLTRGVTAFAPVFELTGMLEDVNFAKLVQQQIVSCVAWLIEEQAGTTSGTPAVPGESGTTTQTSSNGQSVMGKDVYPGMEVNPGKGKKVTGFSPNIPNAEYFQQYRLIIQLICGNLELPLTVGMMDGKETTFHGFIGATNEAKKLWRRSQKRLDKRLHTPVAIGKFFHFAQEDPALRRALKRLKEKFFRHTWHKPVWQSVKPLDDTQDRLMRLRNAIISPSKMHAELNTDYPAHVTETVRDNSLAIRTAKAEAIQINRDPELQDGQPVHWQQLYPMPTPDGIQATTEMVKDREEEQDETDETEVTDDVIDDVLQEAA